MQISKAAFEEMQAIIVDQAERLDKEAFSCRDLEARVRAEDRILEKIVRAVDGAPLIQSRNDNMAAMIPNYFGRHDENHRCQTPTEIEVLREEVATLQGQVEYLKERLAAVRAIAEFAQEHKL